ncbi:ubiquinone biosynthesis methyltransferase UbiE [Pueribacillus theae]|uniref:Ubiquinone biosynthesis methyltransferase UbiE n=1 Tax=Pueribacillus theae TaxID=2171751 RepID=A0A2U1JX34_9BACI|nr:methyltransferase domain-containing protein [Pueribacillus theae]PWA09776.1 ubiquinone biosynthesis methyltransferase UbiE [Pueribacillus theae]
MTSHIAKERAKLTKTSIIDARTLETSNKRLAEILKPGMTVLDVGCGTGAITCGIAEKVGSRGRVIGVDNNPQLIEKARQNYKDVPRLTFEIQDIYDLPFQNQFDIVTSSRVLQWLSNPQKALNMMVQATKINGFVLVLDYNHDKIVWEPEVPKSMQHFYESFLRWRSEAGMDNAIADHLPEMFKEAGLINVKITPQHEMAENSDEEFQTHITIWAEVAQFKGIQMVNDGFISEKERAQAEEDFRRWINERAKSQKMYLLAVEGMKK